MATITLNIPASQVDAIREELLLYQEVKLDSVAVLREHGCADGRLAAVEAERDAVGQLLASVVWAARSSDAAIEVTAGRDLLLDVVHGAMLAAVDYVHEACHRREDDGFDLAEVDRLQLDLAQLIELRHVVAVC